MPARLAATNKCLARTNKSRTRADATKSGDGSAAQFLSHRPSWRAPLRGQRCRSFTALWRRELRAEAEHELAPSRAVFFPLPACRLRGVTGYYLRGHPEVFKKPLPTQVPTRRGSAARTAFKYTPLAAGGDEQTFGVNQQVPHARGCYQSGDGSVAQFPRCEPRSPPCGLTLPVFYRPLAASRAEAEHELARSRPVSFPLRACSFRGVTGYY